MNMYIPLRNFSNFSLGESIFKTEELAEGAKKRKLTAIAICNRMNMFNAIDFSSACVSKKIKPIMGCLLKVSNEKEHLGYFPVFVQNLQGYQNLSRILTEAYIDQKEDHYVHLFSLISCEGIIVLTGDVEGYVFNLLKEQKIDETKNFLQYILGFLGDRLYVEINTRFDDFTKYHLLKIAFDLNIPVVGTHLSSYLDQEEYEAAFIFDCIHRKEFFEEEVFQSSNKRDEFVLTFEEFKSRLPNIPELWENTEKIMKRCSFLMEKKPQKAPFFLGGKEQDDEAFITLCKQNLEEKTQGFEEDKKKIYFQRLEYEMKIITEKNFSGYFLIVSDFVCWAKRQKIPVGAGRGSGAGSICAWVTKICDIDPISFGLIFERFLNPERVSFPDFDIDFCQDKREEVVKYVANKYGIKRVAHIITFGSMKAKMVIRDVARVLKMSFGLAFKISQMIPYSLVEAVTIDGALKSNPAFREFVDTGDSQIKKLIEISLRLEGMVRQSSSHASGIIISTESDICDLLPLYRDSHGEICTQFNMHDVEKSGLIKFDFLGLRTLTIIDHCLQIIKENYNIEIDLEKIDYGDKETFRLLCSANVVGVFQLESGGMRSVLKQLKPDNLGDVGVLIALFRPGPISEIPKYCRRKHKLEEVFYECKEIEEILQETYGVIVYQEQVMNIFCKLAGFSLGEADLVRRAMGKKKPEEMMLHGKKFIEGCKKRNISESVAVSIFDQMKTFAQYAFNKAHSAGYSLISYQTAYLKTHYCAELLCASLNSELNNSDKLLIFINDAKHMGVEVVLPEINTSSHIFKVVNKKIIYSIGALKGLGTRIAMEVEKNAPYKSLDDFLIRNSQYLNKKMIEQLVFSGSLDNLCNNRKICLNLCNEFYKNGFFTKNIEEEKEDFSLIEKINLEKSAFGFFLHSHPVGYLYKRIKFTDLKTLNYLPEKNQNYYTLCLIESITRRKTRENSVFAYVRVSDHSDCIELMFFSSVLKEYSDFIEENTMVVLHIEYVKQPDLKDRFNVRSVIPLERFIKKNTRNIVINLKKNAYRSFNFLQKFQSGNIPLRIKSQQLSVGFPYKIEINKELIENLNLDTEYY